MGFNEIYVCGSIQRHAFHFNMDHIYIFPLISVNSELNSSMWKVKAKNSNNLKSNISTNRILLKRPNLYYQVRG